MAYAVNTTVSAAKTKADIEDMVMGAGAGQFVSGTSGDRAMIGFTLDNRQIRFTLPLPDRQSREFWYTPERGSRRSPQQANAAWEQACRSRWRSLYLVIKAKLEAVESGISTVEREFFYDVVLPDGHTVGEFMAPQIETAYETSQMPPLLPMFGQN